MKKLLLLLCVFLLLCGCDSTSWVNNLSAASFPQEEVLSIPVGARVNQGDYLAYGAYHFEADPEITQTVHNWAVLKRLDTTLFHDSSGDCVVIETNGNYYFLGPTEGAENRIYEFSGMRRSIAAKDGNIPVLLPLHLLSDPDIRSNMGMKIEPGVHYKINDSICDPNEAAEQFFAFYETVYGSDVVMEENTLTLNDTYGKIVFTFSLQDATCCFSVAIT